MIENMDLSAKHQPVDPGWDPRLVSENDWRHKGIYMLQDQDPSTLSSTESAGKDHATNTLPVVLTLEPSKNMVGVSFFSKHSSEKFLRKISSKEIYTHGLHGRLKKQLIRCTSIPKHSSIFSSTYFPESADAITAPRISVRQDLLAAHQDSSPNSVLALQSRENSSTFRYQNSLDMTCPTEPLNLSKSAANIRETKDLAGDQHVGSQLFQRITENSFFEQHNRIDTTLREADSYSKQFSVENSYSKYMRYRPKKYTACREFIFNNSLEPRPSLERYDATRSLEATPFVGSLDNSVSKWERVSESVADSTNTRISVKNTSECAYSWQIAKCKRKRIADACSRKSKLMYSVSH